MLFEYKAINKAGETYTATGEAQDRYVLANRLKEQGEIIISVEEQGTSKHQRGTNIFKIINEALGRVKPRDKILFTRNLSAMIDAGLTISRGLEVMERQTRNDKFRKILTTIRESVQEGTSLSSAIGEHPKVFPSLFSSMIKAGEESGNLSRSLETLGVQMEKTRQLKKRIRGAMMYPSIVVTAMIIVGIVLLVVVVPTLTNTFDELDVELPTSTQIIIGLSNFLKDHIIISLSIIVVIVIGFVVALRQPRTRRMFEWIFLHVPVIGELIRFTNAARTARTLGSLMSSGVDIVESVGITRDVVQNTYYKDVLALAVEKIPKGGAIADAFSEHEDLYPPLVGEMMSVGEESGNLPEMLDRVATFYESEVDERTKNLSTIIEPLLMLVIGSVVGFFAVSMISPIYSISSGI